MASHALLAPFLLIAAASAQSTWIVDASGGGHFTDIPEAIAAADPGDLVVIRAGSYSPFTVTEGIRIDAEQGTQLGTFSGGITIESLPAGQTLVVRGGFAIAVTAAAIGARDCAGHVHLEQLSLSSVRVERCRQVSLHDFAMNGLQLEDSTALVVGCGITAPPSVLTPSHAVRIERSTVVFAGGSAVGGINYSGIGSGSGIELRSGALVLTGDSHVAAGAQPFFGPMPAPALIAEAGTLTLDPGVTLTPIAGGAPIEGAATVTTRTVASVDGATAARTLTATTRGAPGSSVFLLSGPAMQPSLPTPFGELWVGFAHLVIDATVLPLAGTHTTTIRLPVFAPGTLTTLQAIVLEGPALALSAPVVLSVDG